MNTSKSKKTLVLIVIGLACIALAQILARFADLSDSTQGLLTGVGVGLLLYSLYLRKFKSGD